MTSAFQPHPRARLRRTLGLAVALATLGLGAAPALSAPLDELLTLSKAPEQPTPAPTPPEAELRPVDPPLLELPLLPGPVLDPAPEPTPAPGPELTILPTDDVAKSTLSQVTSAFSSTPPGEESKPPAADAPQGTGSPSPEPTTGAAAPEAGASDQGPGAASPAAPTPSGTVTAAILMPVIDAVSRPIGPARRSREIAPTGVGAPSGAPVRVAPLGRVRPRPSIASPAPADAAVRPAPALAEPPRAGSALAPAPIPHAAERVADAVAGAGRSPWLPIALLLATVAYVLGQRLMDGGSKLSHAGRGDEPDDELIEL